jgi:CRP-like cAMP-binding protein
MTPDLDIYEDEPIEDRILLELEATSQDDFHEGLTSKQLAHNVLGKGYTGHSVQKALLRLEKDGKVIQRGRRWQLA